MFGGLALLVGVETAGIGPNWPIGIALFVCAGTLWGVYTGLLRHWRVPMLEGAAGVALVGAVIAAALLGPAALPSLEQAQMTVVAIQVAMQGLVGGVLSVIALIGALNRLSAQTVSMLPTFTPAVAVLIAWAALGTRQEPTEISGAAIILTGFAVASGLIHTVLPAMKRRTI